MNAHTQDEFISPYEAEHIIEGLEPVDLKEYGSKQWFSNHEKIDRLNIQAHKNAMGGSEEYIMDSFVTAGKINVLVQSLLTAEAWKEKVFPIVSGQVAKMSTFRSYVCVYHEATCCNLLEVLLYHRTAVSSDEDALVELIDYCYRKLLGVAKLTDQIEKAQKEKPDPMAAKTLLDRTPKQELEDQAAEIERACAMAALSLLRFVTDYMQELSVPVVHQMMENNDLPCILVPILELKPWIRLDARGNKEKFEDQKWQPWPVKEQGRLTKCEAQIWLSVYNMFMSREANKKYEITTFRKANLLRLRKYLNDSILDQLPMLVDLKRALEELQLMGDNPIAQKNSFIVQQMPEMRRRIMGGRDWKAIAAYQLKNFFNMSQEEMQEEMASLLNLYGSDVYD